jgi:enhancer of mRNA-decapping protein 3
MLEFEQFAISELGLSEDVMTENAARGIAETTLAVLRHLDAEGPPKSPPLIVVVAGNHKSGARAIAASRHLRNHGFRVTATIMGLEREEDLLDMVKQQANAYRKAGGNLMKPTELLAGLKVDILQPTILVDALLGIHTCFDDLRRDDQAWYFELVIWAARTEIKVLSIDVPSGVDASNGKKPSTKPS